MAIGCYTATLHADAESRVKVEVVQPANGDPPYLTLSVGVEIREVRVVFFEGQRALVKDLADQALRATYKLEEIEAAREAAAPKHVPAADLPAEPLRIGADMPF